MNSPNNDPFVAFASEPLVDAARFSCQTIVIVVEIKRIVVIIVVIYINNTTDMYEESSKFPLRARLAKLAAVALRNSPPAPVPGKAGGALQELRVL